MKSFCRQMESLQLLQRAGITEPENIPSENQSSIRARENIVQEVCSQILALTLALGARLGIQIKDDHPVVERLSPHAAYILSRFAIGHGGVTP